jgi:uncharacterized protein involved in outer membrane biogenesis
MKTLFSSLAGAALAVVLAFGVIVLMGWKRVPDLIADELSKKMKVDVHIQHIGGDINTIYVDGIVIDNPDGAFLPQAFSCDKVTFNAALPNYLEEDVVIEEIILDNIYFDLEFDKPRGKKGNWATIMNNAHDSGDEMKNELQGKAPVGDATRSVQIRKLVLNQIKTDLVDRKTRQVQHLPAIDQITLHNLQSEGGSVMNQVVKLVLGQSLKAIFEELHIHHELPGGHLRYLLPLRRFTSSFLKPVLDESESIILR